MVSGGVWWVLCRIICLKWWCRWWWLIRLLWIIEDSFRLRLVLWLWVRCLWFFIIIMLRWYSGLLRICVFWLVSRLLSIVVYLCEILVMFMFLGKCCWVYSLLRWVRLVMVLGR